MTFEEFLIKKKIDRQQFGLAEPALLAEFAFDYARMGEKSFDHTKKYWFNQLRRRYKLEDVVKVERVEEVAEKRQEAGSETPKQTQPEIPLNPKPAFKPRFASAKKTAEPAQEPDAEKTGAKSALAETTENILPKPAFKPRFISPPKPKE